MAGRIQIRDDVIWISHIEGDDDLKAWLQTVPAGATVDLQIDGWRASWVKMADSPDGRPTAGFKPDKFAQARWKAMLSDRGRWCSVSLSEEF